MGSQPRVAQITRVVFFFLLAFSLTQVLTQFKMALKIINLPIFFCMDTVLAIGSHMLGPEKKAGTGSFTLLILPDVQRNIKIRRVSTIIYRNIFRTKMSTIE
jgi:hypothetical protein